MALLKIDPPFEQSDHVLPIQRNDAHENIVGKKVLISGWGSTTNEWFSPQLQKVVLTAEDQELDRGPFDIGHVINLRGSDGKGACSGDSGGKKVQQLMQLHQSQLSLRFIAHIFKSC